MNIFLTSALALILVFILVFSTLFFMFYMSDRFLFRHGMVYYKINIRWATIAAAFATMITFCEICSNHKKMHVIHFFETSEERAYKDSVQISNAISEAERMADSLWVIERELTSEPYEMETK